VTIFEGCSWRLVRWMDADGAAHGVPAGVEATAAFADGFVTGRGGCNGFRGSYVYDGSRLDVGPLAATLMACDEPAMRVEAGFHDGLRRARGARASASSLALLDGAGLVVL
jgi:heat shock protein HslJ